MCCRVSQAVLFFFEFPPYGDFKNESLFIQIIMKKKYLFRVRKKALFIVEKTRERSEDIQKTYEKDFWLRITIKLYPSCPV